MIALSVAGLGLVTTGHAVWPTDVAASAGATKFLLEPRLSGNTVAACKGMSPVSNACVAVFAADRCSGDGCWPGISGTLGYTGTITSYIRGMGSAGIPAAVWQQCQFIAGAKAGVAGVSTGSCSWGTSAPRTCPEGPDSCGYYLHPPFALEGIASPPPPGVIAPLGPWTVSVELG